MKKCMRKKHTGGRTWGINLRKLLFLIFSLLSPSNGINLSNGIPYVSTHNISFDRLLEQAKILNADEDTVGLLCDTNFEVLIDDYSTSGELKDMGHFKDELKGMGLESPLIAHKRFNLFETWGRMSPIGRITIVGIERSTIKCIFFD